MATVNEIISFVEAVYPAAKKKYESGKGVHPLFVTAQAGLERGWRTGQQNNLFGITKGSGWTGKTQLSLTTEYFDTGNKTFNLPEKIVNIQETAKGNYKYSVWRLFRVYDGMESCLEDHFKLLQKPGYADAWPFRDDPREYARRIVDTIGARYATAPDYADAMTKCINMVEKYVKKLGL
ncbi:MAG: glucosaminidase domain-containing protein [Prevotellaceae bacterium]|jgi:flagellar protein FlgJ|nr:glucosaminidase domain-containing protein [Prevotellaceae bacterium]